MQRHPFFWSERKPVITPRREPGNAKEHATSYSERRDLFPIPVDRLVTDVFAAWQDGGPDPTLASHQQEQPQRDTDEGASAGCSGKGEAASPAAVKYIEARRHGALSATAKGILAMTQEMQAAQRERTAARVAREVAARAKEEAAAAKANERAEREARRQATRQAAERRSEARLEAKLDAMRARSMRSGSARNADLRGGGEHQGSAAGDMGRARAGTFMATVADCARSTENLRATAAALGAARAAPSPAAAVSLEAVPEEMPGAAFPIVSEAMGEAMEPRVYLALVPEEIQGAAFPIVSEAMEEVMEPRVYLALAPPTYLALKRGGGSRCSSTDGTKPSSDDLDAILLSLLAVPSPQLASPTGASARGGAQSTRGRTPGTPSIPTHPTEPPAGAPAPVGDPNLAYCREHLHCCCCPCSGIKQPDS